MSPSLVADPLSTRRLFAPATLVGRGTDCTSVPAVVYSSRNAGAELAVRAVTPSPTRTTTTLPGVKAAAKAAGAPASSVIKARMEQTNSDRNERDGYMVLLRKTSPREPYTPQPCRPREPCD